MDEEAIYYLLFEVLPFAGALVVGAATVLLRRQSR